MNHNKAPRTMTAPPLWLRCESCGAVDQLVLGKTNDEPILCRECRQQCRPGPHIEVHSYSMADQIVFGLDAERKLRVALDVSWGQFRDVSIRLAEARRPGDNSLCRVNAVLADGTQIAAESSAATLPDAISQAVDRLAAVVARRQP